MQLPLEAVPDRSPGSLRPATRQYGFGGHQTFPFRHGWLKKAVDAVERDPKLLSQDSAIVELGVGKNMVQSIRHWGLATCLLEGGTGGRLYVSTLGRRLMKEWDPYLEDPASLWLVHWLLVSNTPRAATWGLAFTWFTRPEFTKAELLSFLTSFAERSALRVQGSTLSRDIDCLVRTYIPPRIQEHDHSEDSLDCPLVDLCLLYPVRGGDGYQFAVGHKPTLPLEIFGFALLQYASQVRTGRETIALQECLYGAGSPGQAFKLDEDSVVEYLEALQKLSGWAIELDETAGLRQIYFRSPLDPLELLRGYYEGRLENGLVERDSGTRNWQDPAVSPLRATGERL